MEIQLAHTAELAPPVLDAARVLLERVFEGDFTEHDWEHSLGGMHALVWDERELVGHGSVIQRRLLYRGRALRAGYVEGVGVRADRRRRGYGRALMAELDRVIRGGYEIGALGATDEAIPLYERTGWRCWEGRLAALTPDGMRPTPDDEFAVYVLEVAYPLDFTDELACDWRDGDAW